MKRKGDIADFFVKRHKSGPDQAQADPTPETSSPGSSQPGASQASHCEHRQGPSLPPPGQNIQAVNCISSLMKSEALHCNKRLF